MDLSNQINQVKVLAAGYQAVIDLAAAVADIQSLDQATAEANARLASAKSYADAFEATLASIQSKVSLAQQDLQAVKDAGVKAESDAQASVQAIVDSANTQAASIIAAAQAKADAAATEAAQSMRDAQDYEAKANLLRAQIDELEGKIADARAKVAVLLGG